MSVTINLEGDEAAEPIEIVIPEEFRSREGMKLAFGEEPAGEGFGKRFDPNQPRDPHTGEWIDTTPGDGLLPSVSEGLVAEGDLGPWSKPFEDAVRAVNETHAYPEGTVTSPVSVSSRLRTSAAFFDPYERKITLNPDATPDAGTLLHEFGHKLDEALASVRLNYASKETRRGGIPAMKSLVTAMRQSEAYKRIGKKGVLAEEGVQPGLPYWRSSSEMFARAYAQWLAPRAGVSGPWSDEELESGIQWEPEDFKPIASALEELLRDQGLLK